MRNSSRALLLISTGFIIIICICITIIYNQFTSDVNWASYIPPPYLLINAIILLLIASSRCFSYPSPPPPPSLPSPIRNREDGRHKTYFIDDDTMMMISNDSTSYDPPEQTFTSPEEVEKEIVVSPPPPPELPLISTGNSEKKTSYRAAPEKVTSQGKRKQKKHDTLENTWKTIMENRHVPVTNHLQNSGAVENSGKSEMLRDCTNFKATSAAASSAKLRREVSLSKEEVNRRVEAFINKFNNDIRIQRQGNH